MMNGHATGWSLHGWHCGLIWSAFNMGPFASRIIRVENLMDRPDCPRMPHMSLCVEAHSPLKYTHGPCEKIFSLCQHATCPYFVWGFFCLFYLSYNVTKLGKLKAFMNKGFKLPSILSMVKIKQKHCCKQVNIIMLQLGFILKESCIPPDHG